MYFLKEEAFKVRNAAVEIFTLAAEFIFSGRHGHRKAYQNLFHSLFTHLIDFYMSQHFSVKNDSKLNSSYLNLTVFSIVFYQ